MPLQKLKIGLIREGKVPPDRRVPLTPAQSAYVMQKFPHVTVVAQSSDIRCFSNQDYHDAGVEIAENLEDCSIIMGVKEVPVKNLLSGKTYLFFSHTIKKQAYNQKLMHELIARNIRMVDYELLTDDEGLRLIGFGGYAGRVGAYNALRLYAERMGDEKLIPAHACADLREMTEQLTKLHKRPGYKIVVTGSGRVGRGCAEILEKAGIDRLSLTKFLSNREPDSMVYTVLDSGDYYRNKDTHVFDEDEFYDHPQNYTSILSEYTRNANMYIACHFWNNRGPVLLSRNDLLNNRGKLDIVADISCDIGLPVACTIRASTIQDPFYGYNPETGKECDYREPGSIGVMAVDNLPCELPRDASHDFGSVLIQKVLPDLLSNAASAAPVISRATICENGKLTERFAYLADYAYVK